MLCCFPSFVRANFLGSATATTWKCRGISSCTVSEDTFKSQVSHAYLHAFRVDGRKIRVVFSSVTGSHHDHTHGWRHSGSWHEAESNSGPWQPVLSRTAMKPWQQPFLPCSRYIEQILMWAQHTGHFLKLEQPVKCRPLQVTFCRHPEGTDKMPYMTHASPS